MTEALLNQPYWVIDILPEMKHALAAQQQRYPQMNEEDVVKFAFQAFLGVGHLIGSEDAALDYLQKEMAELRPDENEPLTEELSPEWLRLNLRPARARGISPGQIARLLYISARQPISHTRQDVYGFCTALDPGDRMKAAAQNVLNPNWLPRHSEAYRAAYRPAYRVLHRSCIPDDPHRKENE